MRRVLLDNCVPWRLASHLAPYRVDGVARLGWAHLEDDAILDRMAGSFDVLVTVDKSIPHQQQLAHRPVSVVILRAKANRITDLMPLVLLSVLAKAMPGEIHEIG